MHSSPGELSAGPLGFFRATSEGDILVVERGLPAGTGVETRARLLADARWSIELGDLIAIQPCEIPAGENFEFLRLDARHYLPLAKSPDTGRSVADALRLGRAIARTLARMHAKGIVHGALCPQSIWLDARSGDARFAALDLSFTDSGTVERPPQPQYPNDLRYLAPELATPGTPADRRADLYALGVVLYEALAGRVPFAGADMLAMHHAHSAIEPEPVASLRPDVPPALSQLVQRLLAKDPAERYQSALGVKLDLERILAATNEASPGDVPLLAGEMRDSPRAPSSMFGRKRELDAVSAFLTPEAGARYGTIRGTSGSGKSMLLDHVVSSLPADWLIGRASCDQVRREPHSALRAPLESLLAQIESGGEELERQFTRAAVDALSGSGDVLGSIVTRLQRFVATSEPSPHLSAQAGGRRIHAAFHQLLSAFAALGRPVAIVIDDVQWADSATLGVLHSLLTMPAPPPVSVLLSVRSEELATNPQLAEVLELARAHPSFAMNLEIGALEIADIAEIVADCLDADDVEPLAAALHAHSHGNPLFVVEEIKELWRSGHLHRDGETGAWCWDAVHVSTVPYSTRLSELISLRLHRLPPATRGIVARAACFGRAFDPAQLASVAGVGLDELRRDLEPAFREGVLVRSDAGAAMASIWFGHDQIRSAAYATLDELTRLQSELQIGTLLLGAKHDAEDGLLEAIVHLNAASTLLREQNRESWLARRNLAAARIAIDRAAFTDGYALLAGALRLFDETSWNGEPELLRELHLDAARAACLAGAAASALPLIETLRSHSPDVLSEVSAMEIAIEAFKVLDRFDDAIDTGLEALARLGITLPRRTRGIVPMTRLFATSWKLSRLGHQRLAGLPAMKDDRALAAIRILTELVSPCFLRMPALFPAIVDAQLRLSLAFGNAPESANAYALYAMMLAGPMRRIALAREVSTVALRVLDPASRARVPSTQMAVYVWVAPWVRPLPECLDFYLEGSRMAREVGDPEFANYHASAYAAYSVHAGPALEVVIPKLEQLRSGVAAFGQQRQYAADIYHQLCLNLRSTDGDPTRLAGPIYDEVEHGAAHADAVEMNGHRELARLMLAVLFERHDIVEETRRGFRASMKAFDGMYVSAAFLLYESLALLRSDGGRRSRMLAARTLSRLRRWQRHAPANFAHKTAILKAEIARRRGRLVRAQQLYEEAGVAAEHAGFLLEAGLALEGAREVAAAREMDSLAAHFLAEASRVYGKWGATAKVRELEIRFPSSHGGPPRSGLVQAPAAWSLAPASIDFVGLLEASQALSAGMELVPTIRRIMETIVGLAGAQRGLLLGEGPSGFSVLARAETSASALRVDVFAENDEARGGNDCGYATRVVEHVVEFAAPIILSDPARDPRFADDPHLARRTPRALLCCPITHGKRRTAVVYLEHDRRRDAFGERQLETVRLLSTQAAISLDNARLYDRQLRLSNGSQRFVPHEFLMLLGKSDVDEVMLSDFVKAEMTILVCDIRSFTTMTETMTPEANFDYINRFFSVVGPIVREHSGFVIKYMGDGFMALFPRSADDAAATALALPVALRSIGNTGIGLGLHTGSVAVGAVGEASRLQADVMSDVVTVACRLESLTRHYDVPLVMSSDTRDRLSPAMRERTRPLGRTAVKGRVASVEIYSLGESS